MKTFVVVSAQGNPLYTVTPSDINNLFDGDETPDGVYREVPSSIPPPEVLIGWYWKDTWKQRPTRPSLHHDWDTSLEQWVGNTGRAVFARKIEIEKERSHRNFLPISFDGKRLDADATAQKNLSDKLQEVRERLRLSVPMPEYLLVWRDADNVTHTWADLQSYHDWLAAFTIALAERGTWLYATAWQHKAQIAALTDIEAILNYDVTVGWPA